MSPKPPIERLERLQQKLTDEVNHFTEHGNRLVRTQYTAGLVEIERELLEIIAALKGEPK